MAKFPKVHFLKGSGKMPDISVIGLKGAVEFVAKALTDCVDAHEYHSEQYKIADIACAELTGYGLEDKITAFDVVVILNKILSKEGLLNK